MSAIPSLIGHSLPDIAGLLYEPDPVDVADEPVVELLEGVATLPRLDRTAPRRGGGGGGRGGRGGGRSRLGLGARTGAGAGPKSSFIKRNLL